MALFTMLLLIWIFFLNLLISCIKLNYLSHALMRWKCLIEHSYDLFFQFCHSPSSKEVRGPKGGRNLFRFCSWNLVLVNWFLPILDRFLNLWNQNIYFLSSRSIFSPQLSLTRGRSAVFTVFCYSFKKIIVLYSFTK